MIEINTNYSLFWKCFLEYITIKNKIKLYIRCTATSQNTEEDQLLDQTATAFWNDTYTNTLPIVIPGIADIFV